MKQKWLSILFWTLLMKIVYYSPNKSSPVLEESAISQLFILSFWKFFWVISFLARAAQSKLLFHTLVFISCLKIPRFSSPSSSILFLALTRPNSWSIQKRKKKKKPSIESYPYQFRSIFALLWQSNTMKSWEWAFYLSPFSTNQLNIIVGGWCQKSDSNDETEGVTLDRLKRAVELWFIIDEKYIWSSNRSLTQQQLVLIKDEEKQIMSMNNQEDCEISQKRDLLYYICKNNKTLRCCS